MTVTIIPHATRQIVFPSDVVMTIATADQYVNVGAPSDSPMIVRDMNIIRRTSTSVRRDMQIAAAVSKGFGGVSFESGNPSLAVVNEDGYVTQVGNGNLNIYCRSQWVDKVVSFNAMPPSASSIDLWQSYLSGSLGATIHEAINEWISNSTDKNLFSTANHIASTYVRNPSCWVPSNKTCWPVWNSWLNNSMASGCAITPKHMIFASHATPPVGTTLRFVTNTNSVVTRTVSSHVYYAPADIQISELDSALPGTITPAKVLPSSWNDHVSLGNLPIICANQHLQFFVSDWIRIGNGGYSVLHQETSDGVKASVAGSVVVGDSGSPAFVPIDDQLVLLGCHHTNVPQLTTFISLYIAEINAAIASSGYSLTPINLSGYPTY